MSLTATQILAAGRIIARIKAPYFRAMLLSFETRPLPGLDTVGASARGILVYDPAFVERVTPEQMAGLWLHECLHRIMRHAERCGLRDPRMFNQAGDLAINPAVLDMGCELPKGADGPMLPEQLGWQRGLTADEYYELLRKRSQEQKGQGQPTPGAGAAGEQDQDGDGTGSDASGDGDGGGKDADHDNPGGGDKPHAGGGWCGGCAGRPVPGEPEDKGGGEGDGRTDAELDRINRQTAEAIRDHAQQRGRGSIPASLQRWADGFLQPPKIPWRQKLARCVRNAIAYRDGAVDHRWDGPGRRQAGLGYGQGKPVMPRLRQPMPRVAVAVDTSGSMGAAEMTDALRETRGVLQALGSEVEFMSCDTAVHGHGKIRRIEDAAALVQGGGGTDFRPVFAALEAQRLRPEIVIFVTDGCGPAPAQPPRWCRVIWVLVGPYKQQPVAWGEAVEVE